MNIQDIPCNRLYDVLAFLWPLISDPDEYLEEAGCWNKTITDLLGPGKHRILELGVGGGHNLSHLAPSFNVTAVDIFERMLEHFMRLNPSVDHHAGDMRTVRLNCKFKAVLIHDAISHMLSETDLMAVFTTALSHLTTNGVVITAPDNFKETFKSPQFESRTRSMNDIQLTYLEYTHDPDPEDTVIETIFTHIIRENNDVRIELDRLITGLFPKSTWVNIMTKSGFIYEERSFHIEACERPYQLLLGHKPCAQNGQNP